MRWSPSQRSSDSARSRSPAGRPGGSEERRLRGPADAVVLPAHSRRHAPGRPGHLDLRAGHRRQHGVVGAPRADRCGEEGHRGVDRRVVEQARVPRGAELPVHGGRQRLGGGPGPFGQQRARPRAAAPRWRCAGRRAPTPPCPGSPRARRAPSSRTRPSAAGSGSRSRTSGGWRCARASTAGGSTARRRGPGPPGPAGAHPTRPRPSRRAGPPARRACGAWPGRSAPRTRRPVAGPPAGRPAAPPRARGDRCGPARWRRTTRRAATHSATCRSSPRR